MKRVILHGYKSSSGDLDLRGKLNIYFSSSDGEQYVWTPQWKRGTMQLFIEAYRLEELIRNQSLQTQQLEKPVVRLVEDEKEEQNLAEWDILALEAGKALENRVSLPRIKEAASKIFEFNLTSHPNSKITGRTLKEIYDWIMTLAEQPYTRTKKLVFVKKFIAAMAPPCHPLRTIVYSGNVNPQEGYML